MQTSYIWSYNLAICSLKPSCPIQNKTKPRRNAKIVEHILALNTQVPFVSALKILTEYNITYAMRYALCYAMLESFSYFWLLYFRFRFWIRLGYGSTLNKETQDTRHNTQDTRHKSPFTIWKTISRNFLHSKSFKP